MGTRSWIIVDTLWQSIWTMKRLTVQLIIKFSSDFTSSLINCTKLKLWSQKLSIENQSLSDFWFCNMLSSECWSFTIISLKSFVIPKSMKSLKWISTLYIYLCRKRSWKILFSQRKETNGKQYVCEIVQIASLRMQRATSSQEHVVVLTRSIIRESRDCLKKNSGVPKCCACVAKSIVATIERVTSTNSVARDSIKNLWKTVEMGPCQSNGKCYRKQSTLLQPIEGFEQWNIALQPTNRQKSDCLISTQNVL